MSVLPALLMAAAAAANAISFVGSAGSNTSGSTVSFASGAVASVQAGDLLIYAASGDTNNSITAPGDLTSIYLRAYSGDTGFGAAWWKYAASSDVSASFTSCNTNTSVQLIVFRNAQIADSASLAFGEGTIDPPSLSGFVSGDWALAIGHSEDRDNPLTALTPSGYSTPVLAPSNDQSSGNQSTTMFAYKSTPSATEDPGSFHNTSDGRSAATIRLSPL
jgi:hypothetical protein